MFPQDTGVNLEEEENALLRNLERKVDAGPAPASTPQAAEIPFLNLQMLRTRVSFWRAVVLLFEQEIGTYTGLTMAQSKMTGSSRYIRKEICPSLGLRRGQRRLFGHHYNIIGPFVDPLLSPAIFVSQDHFLQPGVLESQV